MIVEGLTIVFTYNDERDKFWQELGVSTALIYLSGFPEAFDRIVQRQLALQKANSTCDTMNIILDFTTASTPSMQSILNTLRVEQQSTHFTALNLHIHQFDGSNIEGVVLPKKIHQYLNQITM